MNLLPITHSWRVIVHIPQKRIYRKKVNFSTLLNRIHIDEMKLLLLPKKYVTKSKDNC